MFLLTLLADVAKIHFPSRFFAAAWILFRKRAVAGELASKAPLRLCGFAPRAALCFLDRMLCVLSTERTIAHLDFWYYHEYSPIIHQWSESYTSKNNFFFLHTHHSFLTSSITPSFNNNSFKGFGRDSIISFSFSL